MLIRKSYLAIDEWVGHRKPPVNLQPGAENLFSREYERSFAKVMINYVDALTLYSDNVLADGLAMIRADSRGRFLPVKGRLTSRAKRYLTFRRTKPLEHCYLITDTFYKGYFHWWGDCIPRYLIAREHIGDRTLILPAGLSRFHLDTLEILGINRYKIMEPGTCAVLKDVVIPDLVAPTGNYHAATMRAIRDYVRREVGGDVPEGDRKKMYISRSRAPKRKLHNEEALIPLLQDRGYDILFMEELSMKEQIALMKNAGTLIGMHGAGLTNMLFMPEGAKIAEFRLSGDNHNNCYFSLASDLGHQYYYLECRPCNPQEDQHTADLLADPATLEALLSALEEN